MKKSILLISVLAMSIALTAIDMPEIELDIVLDAHFYSGDTANEGDFDTTNRYQIRKAAVSLEGVLTDRVEYAMEFGVATCIGSGDQLRIMEAVVMYELLDDVHVGLKQGHVLKGFAARRECSAQLSMEKPVFMSTLSDCHPQGAVLNGNFDLGGNMALEAELSLMNGPNGTLDGEHDYNLGMIFKTPVQGLDLAGYYNLTERQYYDEDYQQYSEDGFRAGGGIEYRNHNVWSTFEYYVGEGFERDDQKIAAWYAQLGYDAQVGIERLRSIQPFVRYESWDRDIDADEEQLYTYLEAGINVHVSDNTMLRGAFRTNTDTPNGVEEDPDSFIIRLQTGI